jgi:translation initiation factor IF-2
MKKIMSFMLLLMIPVMTFSQIKGKKSKKPFTAPNEKVYKVGEMIQLKEPSNGDVFAYAYEYKSSFSLKSIANAAKSIRDVKNLDVKNVKSITKNLENIQNLADNQLVSSAMSQLMGKAVSEKYVSKNALSSSFSNSKWKIKSFKVFTDKESDAKLVHVLAKGNRKTKAILIDYAIKANQL